METNKIYNMDALEFMQKIEDNSIDLILCDLPYGTTACSWDEIIDLDKMWKEMSRISKKDCAMVFTASQPFTSKLVMSNIKMFKHEWIWEKQKASNFLSMKYSPAKYHENIIVFCKGTPKFNPIKWNVEECMIDKRKTRNSHYVKKESHVGNLIRTRYIDDGSRYPKSIIFIAKATNGNIHPTQKPVALFEYLIETYTNEGDLVMDCVIGSGTTAVACKNINRNFICNDNNLEYVRIANERLSKLNNGNDGIPPKPKVLGILPNFI
jgi:site-specific DNA-methyltransferase (adenine-specific)